VFGFIVVVDFEFCDFVVLSFVFVFGFGFVCCFVWV